MLTMKTLDELLECLRVRFDDGTDPHLWGVYIDMIKSAVAREREAVTDCNHPGNSAAMREAMRKIMGLFRDIDMTIDCPENEAYAIAAKALAAPARQCDVGTAEEQEARYKMMGEVYHTLTLTNALAWAQTPYAAELKGDGDGE